MPRPFYRRVILKISGEAFLGKEKTGMDKKAIEHIAKSIQEIHALGLQIGIVIGGGNIFRGVQAEEFGFSRTPADHIGLLATVINGIVLDQALSKLGIQSEIMSAIQCGNIVESYNWNDALSAFDQGRVLIFVGGTGNPYFTTDTAAALRASEMGAEVVLKATKVDGVYSDDPHKNSKAEKYEQLSFAEALSKNLKVMDATALALCQENKIPIYVFNLFEKNSLLNAVCERKGGSLVT
ncbi:MAG TPA: UMP kinase [Rhabdochlamydiaceae bacterium]|nr:UMP kinase [Rhabdochlamydiaceae bacterium]